MQPGGRTCQPLRAGGQQFRPSVIQGLAQPGCQRQDLVCIDHATGEQPAGYSFGRDGRHTN